LDFQGQTATCSQCQQRILIPKQPESKEAVAVLETGAEPAQRRKQREPDVSQEGSPLLKPFFDLFGHRPKYKPSGLGIASFVIAVALCGIEAIMGLLIFRAWSQDAQRAALMGPFEPKVAPFANCMNMLILPVALVGCGLSGAAILSQKTRDHFFSNIGLVGNGMVIVAVLYLLFLT
jgi:hypothetical protein